ncbi:MAG: hypothetical protein SOY05_05900 [Ellagibacter isourolithinifaciens]|nr:hypothetical protein [Ellagibacter isourolithinifaciens]
MGYQLRNESDKSSPDDFGRAYDSEATDDAANEQVKASADANPEQVDSIDVKMLIAELKPVMTSLSNIQTSYLETASVLSSSIGVARKSSNELRSMVSALAELQKCQAVSVERIRPTLESMSGISRAMEDAFVSSVSPFESVMRNTVSTAGMMRRLLMEYSSETKQFTEQIKSQSEGMNRMVESAAAVLSDAWVPNVKSVVSLTDQFSSSISHVFEQLIKIFPLFDWQGKGETIVRWGKFGWTIYPAMSVNVVMDAPDSLVEADKIMRGFLTPEYMESVRNRLAKVVRKKRDLEEALWLFDQRHYKPCAMMLCSMIEGELFLRAKKNEKSRRSAREPIKRLKKLCSTEGVDACVSAYIALGACESYGHFFANGEDFKRDIEGDLNRNFLQHGMMYKRVTRTVCVKLLLLLDGIVEACSVYL